MEATVHVGQTIKTFGREGHIKVHIEKSYQDDVANSRYLFLNIEGCLLPYFLESYDKDSSLIKFDEIHNPQDGKLLSDTKLFLFQSDVTKLSRILPDSEIIGYLLIDQNDKKVGVITEILEMPMQVLLKVRKESQFFLVPFHEDILLKFDTDKGYIQLQLAEGLEDI